METRSKLNLNKLSIQSLEFKTSRGCKSKRKLRKEFKRQANPLGNVLLFDTESTYFDVSEGSGGERRVDKRMLMPFQIAFGIYRWNEREGRLDKVLDEQMFYVSEMFTLRRYRSQLENISYQYQQKHERNMEKTGFPLLAAKEFLTFFVEMVNKYNVNTFCAYNISWDFEAFKNLVWTFDPENEFFRTNFDNPFPSEYRYLDLMHNTYKIYSYRLIESGVNDGTIHRNGKTRRIDLKKDKGNGKGIYSAQYAMYNLLGIEQRHFASHDVIDESRLLERCVQDAGTQGLEYNIMHPYKLLYQRVLETVKQEYKEILKTT